MVAPHFSAPHFGLLSPSGVLLSFPQNHLFILNADGPAGIHVRVPHVSNNTLEGNEKIVAHLSFSEAFVAPLVNPR